MAKCGKQVFSSRDSTGTTLPCILPLFHREPCRDHLDVAEEAAALLALLPEDEIEHVMDLVSVARDKDAKP